MFSGIKRFLHYSLVLVLIDGRYVKHPKGRDSVLYARPNVTKCQVYQFFMSTKNLHIKSFTLLPSCLFFMSRWKFTHQVYYIVISCQFFLTKVHIYWSSFLLWYQVSCWISKHVVSRPLELFQPGHHQAFLIYETVQTWHIFFIPSTNLSSEGKEKVVFYANITNLISKQETWLQICTAFVKKNLHLITM